MSLTDRAVVNLKPTGKSSKHFDGGGLHLVVYPNGGKAWRLAYRFQGKAKLLSLGMYPAVGLKMARDRREEAKALLAQNIDPGEQKKQDKQAAQEVVFNTFEIIGREWHDKFKERWTAKNASAILGRMERDIFSLIGKISIRDVSAPQLLDIIRRIEARGALDYAHRALQYCGMIFRYATRPMSNNTVNAALRRLGYSKEEMTGHGFRSMASTLLNEKGWNRDAIERQLAHAERNAVRAAYNFAEFLPERRKMMQAWADYLSELRDKSSGQNSTEDIQAAG